MALKHWFICTAAAGLACGGVMAQERARVLSAVPVVQQVGIPQQFCEDTQVYSGARTTGNGQLIEALAQCARNAGRAIASPAEARALLGLQPRSAHGALAPLNAT